MLIYQGDSWVHLFWMVESYDPTRTPLVRPALGRTVTVQICKAGLPYQFPDGKRDGIAFEVGKGLYGIQLNGNDSALIGEIAYDHQSPGCEAFEGYKDQVLARLPGLPTNQDTQLLGQIAGLIQRLVTAERA